MACLWSQLPAQAARAQYLELQNRLRRELGLKRSEKDNNKIMEAMSWGAPEGGKALSHFRVLYILKVFFLSSPRPSAHGFLA